MIEIILIAAFLFFLLTGVPIAFVLGLVGLLHLILTGQFEHFLPIVMRKMIQGADNFVLVAVPMFMLAGNLMNAAGITTRLVRFADALVGWLRGGLGHVNVVVSMIFAGITGIATADTSAMCTVMVPAMEKQGYDREFATGVTATSSLIGAVIPPSVQMVLFSVIGGVSTGKLFSAGFLPGVMLGLSMMALVSYFSIKRKYPISSRFSIKNLVINFVKSSLALSMPVVMIGGLIIGVFSPTEASSVGVGMALIIGFFVYKELKIKDLPGILWRSGRLTAAVMVLVATAAIFSFTLTIEDVPVKVAGFLLSLTTNKYVFLIYINILLLFIGTFMDITASTIILTPILLPVAQQYGVDPVHFGLIMVLNLVIGVATPPVGIVIFVTSAITGLSFERVVRAILPFLLASILVLLITTYWEGGVMFIPNLFFPE
jgi:C4-dicarboxylate transporter DctM subunit